MPRLSAVVVLRRMMDELAADNWPSEQTWADACRVTGRPVPSPLATVGGKGISTLDLMGQTETRRFNPSLTPAGRAAVTTEED